MINPLSLKLGRGCAAFVLMSLCLASAPHITAQEQQTGASRKGSAPTIGAQKPTKLSQRFTQEGLVVEFNVEPVAAPQGETGARALMEGAEATVTFRITDAATGQPLTSLRPAAWIDGRETGAADGVDAKACREKVQSFLQGSLRTRPDIDLNSYYILALNQEPNISVIDPLLGLGSTKLLTLVALEAPGADWVMSADGRRLYVSMPAAGKVAVVDTATWKVTTNIAVGAHSPRLRLQRDGKYLWVTQDAGGPEAQEGGVSVIDTATNRVAAQITTGAGDHDLALSNDDRTAFVTNGRDGTLTLIDTARLTKIGEVKTGAAPVAVAYSEAGRAAYVAHGGADGSIVAVDAARREVAARIGASPGLVSVGFAPGGRYGFAVNRKESSVHIFDAATNRLLHTVAVGASPDQVAFTNGFAYVRSLGSEQVTMIRLSEIGREGIEQAVSRFPGGQSAPQEAKSVAYAPAMVNAPEAGAMLVANPADGMIYYYMEGMAAPMGTFRNYRRQPLAVMVWDASLRETAPGVYTTRARLNGHGTFDVPFLLDSPRVINCFELAVAENPDLKKSRQPAVKFASLLSENTLTVGREVRLRFRVTNAETAQPIADLKDVGVLAFLAPGIWQHRDAARHTGEGVYEFVFTPPQEGVYYVFFQSPSLGVQYRQSPPLILSASKDATTTGKSGVVAQP